MNIFFYICAQYFTKLIHFKVVTNYLQQLFVLLKRLALSYLLYFLCRLLFFYANTIYFPGVGFGGLMMDCFYGLRFDTFSVVVSNSLFILLSILPLSLFNKRFFQALLRWIFYVSNAVFIAFNCVDAGYFQFIRKRSSYDLFKQMGGQTDVIKLLPQYLKDFWWVGLVYCLLLALMGFLYRRIQPKTSVAPASAGWLSWLKIALLFILTAGLCVLGVRGGFQRVPIDIVNAGSMTSADEIPLVLNTPFTLIKSVSQHALEELPFFTEEEVKRRYNPIHQFSDSVFKKQNVVVILLESFAKEYTKLGRKMGLTPFLDSLMGHSLVFTNAFANGSKSIEGIPAILSSLPSLMENPFINSIYANNKQTSLASILKQEGYTTAFFHGGINGTMNFTDWAPQAGYAQYFGRNEYNNDKDFDGFWGIWDEPFLQFAVKKMSSFRQPFHSAIFTLSSHHPYFVPEKYSSTFAKGPLENSQSIRYADYALRQFFAAAQKTSWYSNTLFVVTADHASLSEHYFFSNVVGNQSIPIFFFRPDNSLNGTNSSVFSQMDILPSTLQLLGYSKPFFAFGESFVKKKQALSYFYSSSNYYVFNDSMVYYFNGDKATGAYNYRRDSSLSNDLLSRYPFVDSASQSRFRAFLQTYQHSLIHNAGTVK